MDTLRPCGGAARCERRPSLDGEGGLHGLWPPAYEPDAVPLAEALPAPVPRPSPGAVLAVATGVQAHHYGEDGLQACPG